VLESCRCGEGGSPVVDGVRVVARRVINEVINGGDLAVFDELVAEEYVDHTGVPDREAYRQLIVESRAAFPDLRLTIEDEIVEGDRWVGRFRWIATHCGDFMGVPATGRQIIIEAIGILRIVDGRLVERWNVTDVFGLLQQIGGLPEQLAD
jgi:predicted ester cyclase